MSEPSGSSAQPCAQDTATQPTQEPSTLTGVKAIIAKEHDGKGIGADDPMWALYSMFEVFISDLSVLLGDAATCQAVERDKLQAVVTETPKILADQMKKELTGLSEAFLKIRNEVKASSIEALLKQQGQFSAELGDITSRIKRIYVPLFAFTASNWLAVGALYHILK